MKFSCCLEYDITKDPRIRENTFCENCVTLGMRGGIAVTCVFFKMQFLLDRRNDRFVSTVSDGNMLLRGEHNEWIFGVSFTKNKYRLLVNHWPVKVYCSLIQRTNFFLPHSS